MLRDTGRNLDEELLEPKAAWDRQANGGKAAPGRWVSRCQGPQVTVLSQGAGQWCQVAR